MRSEASLKVQFELRARALLRLTLIVRDAVARTLIAEWNYAGDDASAEEDLAAVAGGSL